MEGKQPCIAEWWDGVPRARVCGDHTMGGGKVNTEHGSIYIYMYNMYIYININMSQYVYVLHK